MCTTTTRWLGTTSLRHVRSIFSLPDENDKNIMHQLVQASHL